MHWAPYFSGSWLVLLPNSITHQVENLRSVNSIQVQVLGHHIYAITNLSSICCLHISLGHLLLWFLAASQISLPIFSVVSLVLQPHLTTLLLSGTNHDLFLIWRHKLSCVLDKSVLLSVLGTLHGFFDTISLHFPNILPDLKPTQWSLLSSCLCPLIAIDMLSSPSNPPSDTQTFLLSNFYHVGSWYPLSNSLISSTPVAFISTPC